MRHPIVFSAAILLTLAACDSTEMGATGQLTQPAAALSRNILPQTGQGNSGGIVVVDGQSPVAGVEATMSFNAGGRSSGARVDFHNGPLAGTGIRCERIGGGAGVPKCPGYNAEEIWLVQELSSGDVYVGAFAVNGIGPGKNTNAFVAIHSAAGNTATAVNMPAGSAQYTGEFQSSGSVTSGAQTFNGKAWGTATLQADFAKGTVSGNLNGNMSDRRTFEYAKVDAGFSNAVIDPTGRIFNDKDTTFSFSGAQAWGDLDAAFYGGNAEKAAGAFSFGNSQGGMTGIMVLCEGPAPTSLSQRCVHPMPRF